MFEILLSLFGILIVHRNLSLLEKFEVISARKIFLCFPMLQLPLFLFMLFKDQVFYLILFIGIFSITLIAYRPILEKIARNTYEKCHLRIIDHLILLLKSGKSASIGVRTVFAELTPWEKRVFQPLENIFDIRKEQKPSPILSNELFFTELTVILTASHQVADQLRSFRDGLKVIRNLRHKSRQVTQQIRAQAIVAVFIYLLLLFISIEYLELKQSWELLLVSAILFITGLFMIFFCGGRLRWKT